MSLTREVLSPGVAPAPHSQGGQSEKVALRLFCWETPGTEHLLPAPAPRQTLPDCSDTCCICLGRRRRRQGERQALIRPWDPHSPHGAVLRAVLAIPPPPPSVAVAGAAAPLSPSPAFIGREESDPHLCPQDRAGGMKPIYSAGVPSPSGNTIWLFL